MRKIGVLSLALVGLLAVSSGAAAEVYRWTDASGRLHFAQDLSQVPPGQRAAAERAARAPRERDPIQTFSAPAAPAPRPRATAAGSGAAGRAVRIHVQRAGNSMRVMVRLNDRVVVPFVIDTGASDVVVPEAVVAELGIDLSQARTGRYQTANGVIETKLITLGSVDLGGARVEGVPAAVGKDMPVGLLGLSYFNRFNYQIDPGRGVVTLEPNQLERSGLIRGGRSQSDWRSEYAQLNARLRELDARRARTPSSRSRRLADLQHERSELERQLEVLELEADVAHVPFSWRE